MRAAAAAAVLAAAVLAAAAAAAAVLAAAAAAAVLAAAAAAAAVLLLQRLSRCLPSVVYFKRRHFLSRSREAILHLYIFSSPSSCLLPFHPFLLLSLFLFLPLAPSIPLPPSYPLSFIPFLLPPLFPSLPPDPSIILPPAPLFPFFLPPPLFPTLPLSFLRVRSVVLSISQTINNRRPSAVEPRSEVQMALVGQRWPSINMRERGATVPQPLSPPSVLPQSSLSPPGLRAQTLSHLLFGRSY